MENKNGLIKQVNEDIKKKLKDMSVENMPNRPSAAGMKAEDIKKAFYEPIYNANNSVLAEIDRVIKELNDVFSRVSNVEKLNDKNGQYPVTATVLLAVKATLETAIDTCAKTTEVKDAYATKEEVSTQKNNFEAADTALSGRIDGVKDNLSKNYDTATVADGKVAAAIEELRKALLERIYGTGTVGELDTINELAQALKDQPDVISALEDLISARPTAETVAADIKAVDDKLASYVLTTTLATALAEYYTKPVIDEKVLALQAGIDAKPFTAEQAGRFVIVAADGSLESVEIQVGGAFG